MGLKQFFQGLFSRSAEQEVEDEYEEELDEAYSSLPSFYKGAPIDVMSADGKLIFSGRLASYAQHEMVIDRIPGEMSFPTLETGRQVKIRSFSQTWEPYNLLATVIESNVVMCRISNLELLPYRNNRKDCRQPVNVSAALYATDDTRLSRPNECRVLDISIGGARVSSPHEYVKGETVRLRVELIEKGGRESFIGQIIRVTRREDNTFEYGLLFAQMNQRQIGSLSRDIIDIQREVLRKLQD